MTMALDQAARDYTILLDTCFAMSESFKDFVRKYEGSLRRNKVNVPVVVLDELKNLARESRKPKPGQEHARQQARQALQMIAHAQQKGLLAFVGDALDAKTPKQTGAADAVFVSRVNQLLLRKNVLMLTKDKGLADQLRALTQTQNYAVKNLMIYGGKKMTHSTKTTSSKTTSSRTNVTKPVRSSFVGGTALESNLDTRIRIQKTVQEGSSLRTHAGQSITLGKKLAEGGEGSVYEINNSSLVCKIYHTAQNNYHLTEGRRRKIELMLTRPLNDPQICYPISAVYDASGTFRGFTMPKAAGKPLGRGLFLTSFAGTNPGWNRTHSTQLALTILHKIEYLHSQNILIGDINPLNILVVDENTVYFVDCDSYQIGGFPCPVGTPTFTAPEIQGKDFKSFLRTMENELFAVATLLFMIFMPGKAPYGHEGGEDVGKNIKLGLFPYALGERKSHKVPKGPWRLCWSHLSREMKVAFNRSFHLDERGKKRIEVGKWIQLMEQYCCMLQQKGYIGPKMQVGIDLSILPKNMQRILVHETQEIQPPLRKGGMTDSQYWIKQLVNEMANGSGMSRSNSSYNYIPNTPKPRKTPSNQTPSPKKQTQQPPKKQPQKSIWQILWDWFFN